MCVDLLASLRGPAFELHPVGAYHQWSSLDPDNHTESWGRKHWEAGAWDVEDASEEDQAAVVAVAVVVVAAAGVVEDAAGRGRCLEQKRGIFVCGSGAWEGPEVFQHGAALKKRQGH